MIDRCGFCWRCSRETMGRPAALSACCVRLVCLYCVVAERRVGHSRRWRPSPSTCCRCSCCSALLCSAARRARPEIRIRHGHVPADRHRNSIRTHKPSLSGLETVRYTGDACGLVFSFSPTGAEDSRGQRPPATDSCCSNTGPMFSVHISVAHRRRQLPLGRFHCGSGRAARCFEHFKRHFNSRCQRVHSKPLRLHQPNPWQWEQADGRAARTAVGERSE